MDMDKDYQKLIMRWMSMGHEIIHERRLYRHKVYRKDFAPDRVITLDGLPLMSFGETVKFGDLLPERADLCLDMNGAVVDAQTFTTRYKDYLRGFDFPEMADLDAEFVPDVKDYILATPDKFSDSRGFVPIHYDARKKPDEVRTHLYDPNNDQMIEIAKNQQITAEVLQAMLEQIATPEKRGPGRPRKEL